VPAIRHDPACTGFWQTFNVSLQLSVVQVMPSPQLRGEPPPHAPAVQVSPTVQNWPSLQDVPFGAWLLRQSPAPSQVSGSLQSVNVPSPQETPVARGG